MITKHDDAQPSFHRLNWRGEFKPAEELKSFVHRYFFGKRGNVQFPSVSSSPCFSVLISDSTSQDELAVLANLALMHSGERSQN